MRKGKKKNLRPRENDFQRWGQDILSFPEIWHRYTLSYPSHQIQLKPWTLYVKHKRTLKNREKMTDYLGNSGSTEQHDIKFLGFSFCLTYPTLVSKEYSTLEISIIPKKTPTKSQLCIFTRPGKRKLIKLENVWTLTTLFQSNKKY